jgi:hypothetical protein
MKIIYLIISLLLISNIASECTKEMGCQIRKKYMSYVTVLSKDGTPMPLVSKINYKVIYVLRDKLVFFASKDPGAQALEPDENLTAQETDARIERTINFNEIILDCGGFGNKLCHAGEYPDIVKIKSYDMVKKKVATNPEVLCIVIPFFENGYQKMHEKVAYMCADSDAQLKDLITFKNKLSRSIEFYQLDSSMDRYNGANGIVKRRLRLITTDEGNQPVPVIGKLFRSGIFLYTNNEKRKLIRYYSLYQQRVERTGIYRIPDGMSRGYVPKDWSKGLVGARPDCCIYFKGENENMTICIGASDNKNIEPNPDTCKNKIDSLFRDLRNSLRAIKFAESFHELLHNKEKRNDCKSKEYNIMKDRAMRTCESAIKNDCKNIMDNLNTENYSSKYNWCKENYSDELKLELKLMSLGVNDIYESINKCVYGDKEFKKVFELETFKKKMRAAKLLDDGGPISFLASVEYNEEDIDSILLELNSEYAEAEMGVSNEEGDHVKAASKGVKQDTLSPNSDKVSSFRSKQMNELQSGSTFRVAKSETIEGGMSLMKRAGDDEFVNYIGKLSDTSSKIMRENGLNEKEK